MKRSLSLLAAAVVVVAGACAEHSLMDPTPVPVGARIVSTARVASLSRGEGMRVELTLFNPSPERETITINPALPFAVRVIAERDSTIRIGYPEGGPRPARDVTLGRRESETLEQTVPADRLASLPPGRYRVEAAFAAVGSRTAAFVPAGIVALPFR